jgi:ribosome-binding protein aMBF1 (putative translation factor)
MKYDTNEIYMLLEFISEQITEINDNVRVLLNRSLSTTEPRKNPIPTQTPVIDRDKVKALRKAGWSYSQIAEELNASKSTIAKIVQKEERK